MTQTIFVTLETSAVNESRGVREFRGSRKMFFISAYLACVLHIMGSLCIQLFRERLSEKNVHWTIPKVNYMGYDQFTVPDTVAFEPTFVAFL